MDKIKFAIPVLALLGVISVFLPWVSMAGQSVNFLGLHNEMTGYGPVMIVFAGLALALIVGAIRVQKGLGRGTAIACALGFALALLPTVKAFGAGAIGAKLLVIVALVGVLASIAKIVKPDSAQTAQTA